MELLLDNLFMSIESYKTISNKNNELFVRIYCSRGGMRSQSIGWLLDKFKLNIVTCLLYTSPSPRDNRVSRMPSSA